MKRIEDPFDYQAIIEGKKEDKKNEDIKQEDEMLQKNKNNKKIKNNKKQQKKKKKDSKDEDVKNKKEKYYYPPDEIELARYEKFKENHSNCRLTYLKEIGIPKFKDPFPLEIEKNQFGYATKCICNFCKQYADITNYELF